MGRTAVERVDALLWEALYWMEREREPAASASQRQVRIQCVVALALGMMLGRATVDELRSAVRDLADNDLLWEKMAARFERT